MTAVAPPPNFQPVSRSGWSAPNGASNGAANVNTDDVSRMFMQRKSAQRTNSSSSLSSQASSSSTLSASSQVNGSGSNVGEGSGWGTRKKPTRGLWPSQAKSEPIAGITTARPQSIASATSGASAAAAISALHSPAPMISAQHGGHNQTQQGGSVRGQQGGMGDAVAVLQLSPINGTFERKNIHVPFQPDFLRIGRQTNNKTVPTSANGYFDSKVLSRQHAEIWADRSGKIWIKDVKSSNGTFVNGQRLSPENKESEPHELREQDVLELGIDIVAEDQKSIVHHKVAAKVEHAGLFQTGGSADMNLGDLDSHNGMNGAYMGQPNGQMRGRVGSQGSMNSNGRYSNSGGVPGGNPNVGNHPRHMNFWLQPISMEQVVKRLNSEIKQARQQSQDLQRTTAYIDSLLAAEPRKDNPRSSPNSQGRANKSDLKARFSEPPAPPPQQPLPEKPDVPRLGEPAGQPPLRRSDTERPKNHNSLTNSESASHISSLTAALSTAKKELETQSQRLQDLENLLAQERKARESAEERAARLELDKGTSSPEPTGTDLVSLQGQEVPRQSEENGRSVTEASPETSHDDSMTARLQQRLEAMMAEMDEMRQQMERYRQRAETAESESAAHRKSLEEMIEKIRRDEANRTESGNQKQKKTKLPNGGRVSEIDGTDDKDMVIQRKNANTAAQPPEKLSQTGNTQNGSASPGQAALLGQSLSHALRTQQHQHQGDALLYGGPAVSFFGIVLVGVGIMTWLNSWPKVER